MNRKTPALILICVASVAILAYLWIRRSADPITVASEATTKLAANDLDWIWDHSTEAERSGISKDLVVRFQATFLGPLIRKGDTVEYVRANYQSPNKGAAVMKWKSTGLPDREIMSVGYLEDGQLLVGAFEQVFYTYAQLKRPGEPWDKSLDKAWRDVSPWFRSQGQEKIYIAQGGFWMKLPY